jgi:NADH dehydrogenase
VRILTRNPERARQQLGDRVEFAAGDVRHEVSLQAAADEVTVLVSALTGFGPGGLGPRAVDYEGNLNLIRAAEAAGVHRFVLLSMHGASADHPMELLRWKYRAEEALRASSLDSTIVRPTVFMELWAGLIGNPIRSSGRTAVLGRGDNPVNFISVQDVARFVEMAALEPGLSRETIDVGGPENLTFNQVVLEIESAAGRKASVRHVPIPVMRLARSLLRPFRPDVAGMIEAGIVTDSIDMSFDAAELQKRFPQIELTRMAEVVRRQFDRAATRKMPGLESRRL